MRDALHAEFDTLADWTARVALDLGADFHIPAACRGSGSPAALDWLIDTMALTAGDLLLDCGAGVGGPAAYAAHTRAVQPVLVEPETGACRAAQKLFSHSVIQAVGTALPLPDATFDAAWALGVLCTTAQQHTLLGELCRVVRPGGSIGLLVFVAEQKISSDYVEDNHFPTTGELNRCLDDASLAVTHRISTSELPAIPAIWNERVDAVTEVLEERYGHTSVWQIADRQSTRIGKLLGAGDLRGELLVARSRS
ncbi:MAG: class I SAM-dependent methyltransferase [Mycobacterium sp.]